MNNIKELTDKELEQVSGGSGTTNTKDQGPKYKENTRVKYYHDRREDFQVYGTIISADWSNQTNQYEYRVNRELTRFIKGVGVHWLESQVVTVKEEDIIYDV